MAFDVGQIEDGRGVKGAVVYALKGSTDPVGDAEAYLSLTGKTAFIAAAGDINGRPKKEVFLFRGTEFVERLAEGQILGYRVRPDQGLLLPRWSMMVDGRYLPFDEIPESYLRAVWLSADFSAQGFNLNDIVEKRNNVKREKTGRSLETEWFPGGASGRETYLRVLEYLTPLLMPEGMTVRG